MWRYYYWEWKTSVEDYSKTIDIKFLKTYGYLDKWLYSRKWGLYWKRNWEDNWNIWVEINKWDTSWYIRVTFTQTNMDWEKKELDYKIQLVSTPCNYWGVRWWLLCPCKWNRCSILYKQNNWIFASRKTLDLCYGDQKESKRYRYMSYLMWKPFNDMYLLKDKIKYPYRNWKPTRKMRRFLKLHHQMPSMEEVKNISSLLWKK